MPHDWFVLLAAEIFARSDDSSEPRGFYGSVASAASVGSSFAFDLVFLRVSVPPWRILFAARPRCGTCFSLSKRAKLALARRAMNTPYGRGSETQSTGCVANAKPLAP